jgi:hypothetical protein
MAGARWRRMAGKNAIQQSRAVRVGFLGGETSPAGRRKRHPEQRCGGVCFPREHRHLGGPFGGENATGGFTASTCGGAGSGVAAASLAW